MAAYVADAFYRDLWRSNSKFMSGFMSYIKTLLGREQSRVTVILKEELSKSGEQFRFQVEEQLCALWSERSKKLDSTPLFYRVWEEEAFKILDDTYIKLQEIVNSAIEECLTNCLYLVDRTPAKVKKEYSPLLSGLYLELYNARFKALSGSAVDGMHSMLRIIGETYREAFSDLCSIRLLESTKASYLNLFRGYHGKQAHIDPNIVIRIEGVLRACFADGAGKDMAGGLYKNVDMYKRVLTPLVEYLQACDRAFSTSLQPLLEKNALESVRKLYRSSQPDNSDVRVPDISSDAVEMLLKKWASAAQTTSKK